VSLNNFTPSIWAAKLLQNWNNAHVAIDCVSREFEGDIKNQGDTVIVGGIGRVTITAHTKNTDITAVQTLQDVTQSLVVDQADHFNFQIDDIDKVQNKPSVMGEAMRESAWGLADVCDKYLLALLYNGVTTTTPDNALASRALGTGASDEDAYETLIDLGVLLDESNCPTNDRFCLVPPWVEGLLLKDPRFVSFGTAANEARLRNGRIGQAAGFEIRKSNNIYSALSSTYAIIVGSKQACTFAWQITKTEAYSPEKRFCDAIKGLQVYGAKIMRPYALATCPVTVA